jgi:hypothetical protein
MAYRNMEKKKCFSIVAYEMKLAHFSEGIKKRLLSNSINHKNCKFFQRDQDINVFIQKKCLSKLG